MNFIKRLFPFFQKKTTEKFTFPKPTNKYLSAREGTFDKNYFIAEETNKFKFPKFNKDNNKYLVKIKDITNYGEYYFDGYNAEERDSFAFEDFEKIFLSPELEIECFEDFLEKLSAKYFEKAIGKTQTLFLFEEFEDFLDENELNDEPLVLISDTANKLVELDYIKKSEEQFTQSEYITSLSQNELKELCKLNNIKPFKTKKALTNQVLKLNLNLNIPVVLVNPTEKLKSYFLTFVELYISELRKNADRFHPLYIEPIFQEALYTNDNKQVKKLIENELKSEYWRTRIEAKTY